MTAFAKAYTLLREEEHRKKADVLRRASNFATLAGYYRYRDEQDFQALVAARDPLVMELYPELFPLESQADRTPEPEPPELETPAEGHLETQSEGPESALKYIGPLAWEKVLHPNSVLTQEPEPCVSSLDSFPPRSPEESFFALIASEPEVRELGPSLSDEAPEVELLPAEEEPAEEEPLSPLWGQLIPLLLAVVGEQNFEIWLSSVRQGPVFDKLIIFQVPNSFFQEYLTEHHAPIIKELLASLGEHRTFLFQAVAKEASLPTAKAAKAPEPAPEAAPKPPTTKWERRQEDLARAREDCTVFDPIYAKYILRIKEHAMLLDVLKLKWAEEDAAPSAPPIKLE
jgi:DnaA N-terminal domain